MKNLVSIVEIPTLQFSRALTFYQNILNISIEKIDMGGITMGLFSIDAEAVTVALVNGDGYKPAQDGVLAYLNGGDDLQPVLERIKANGGKTVTPKTEISPDIGFYALFIDSEGNRLGLYSKN